jgi:hypothetical protein
MVQDQTIGLAGCLNCTEKHSTGDLIRSSIETSSKMLQRDAVRKLCDGRKLDAVLLIRANQLIPFYILSPRLETGLKLWG